MRIGEKLYHIRFGIWHDVIGTGNEVLRLKGFCNSLCSLRYMPMPGVRYNEIRLRETWRIPLQLLPICNPGRLPRPALPDKAARPARSAH